MKSPDASPRRTPLRLRLALVGASLLSAFALAELLARSTGAPAAPIALQQFAEAVEEGHGTNFDRIFAWDPELLWRLAPDVRLPQDERPFFGLVSNAQGLREDHRIEPGPHRGELRVLFLGDSVTFGYLVPQPQCFVEQLERALAARFAGRRIECIDAGVPGYTLVQGLRFLELEGLAYEPDLVVLAFGWNERASWSGGGDLERLGRRARARPPAILAWSRVLSRLFSAAEAEEDPDAAPRARVTPEEFHAELERARTLCASRDIALALLVTPGKFNLKADDKSRTYYQIQQYLVGRELSLGDTGAPALVDGVAAFRELAQAQPGTELFFDGVHPTELGHARLARELERALDPWLRDRLEAPDGKR